MKRALTTLTLCGVLLLTPGAEAVKKKPQKAPPPTLTLTEQWCAYFGRITGAIAHDRDTLVPLTTTIGRLRVILADVFKRVKTPRGTALTEEMVKLAQMLYAHPEMSGAQARHAFEVGCVNAEPTTTPLPTGGMWR